MPASRTRSRILYIERKAGVLTGPARIGRVWLSKTARTLYYRGLAFRSLKGGYKANYFEVASGDEYWISGPKRAGGDTLYPGIVEIDEDVREEYWLEIRQLPARVRERRYRSDGKYRK